MTDPTAALVACSGLGVRSGAKWLVRGVDLAVRPGEIVTLIGPNGAGKSTVVKALLGLTAASAGVVRRRADLRVGYVPQSLPIDGFTPLTVRRLMTLTDRPSCAQVDAALARTGVRDKADQDLHSLSGGEFQRALLARAIARRPNLLVLDEPAQTVDFTGQSALYGLIAALRDELGCGVLLISHDLHIVMAQTDTVVCLNGHVCCHGAPAAVAADPAYRRLFGPAADALAVYQHHHDHRHEPDGAVRPAEAGPDA